MSNKTIKAGFISMEVNLDTPEDSVFASTQQPADCFCKGILPEQLWELQDYGATTGVSVARKEEGACRVRIIRRPSGF